jgi:hypothetical protein
MNESKKHFHFRKVVLKAGYRKDFAWFLDASFVKAKEGQ